jgi:hypothetical protein
MWCRGTFRQRGNEFVQRESGGFPTSLHQGPPCFLRSVYSVHIHCAPYSLFYTNGCLLPSSFYLFPDSMSPTTLQEEKGAQFEEIFTQFEDKVEASTLPSPVSTPAPKQKLSASAIIPVWIVLSSSVIIYNNYLYNSLEFRYPVFLVTWHLTFAVRFQIFLF